MLKVLGPDHIVATCRVAEPLRGFRLHLARAWFLLEWSSLAARYLSPFLFHAVYLWLVLIAVFSGGKLGACSLFVALPGLFLLMLHWQGPNRDYLPSHPEQQVHPRFVEIEVRGARILVDGLEVSHLELATARLEVDGRPFRLEPRLPSAEVELVRSAVVQSMALRTSRAGSPGSVPAQLRSMRDKNTQ